MKRLFVIVGFAWVATSVGVLAARQTAPATPGQAGTPAPAVRPVAARAQTAGSASTARPAPGPATVAADGQAYKAMVDRYCVGCHNQRTNTPAARPLYLDKVDASDPTRDAAVWENVVRKMAVGAMPPQGSPRPEPAVLAGFSTYLATTLDRAAAAANNPGNFQLHRLNRAEYANAVRDLLDLQVDVSALLPPDSSDFGFDNIASVLKVTPTLLERYLTAGMRIATLAVGDPKAEVVEEKFPVRLDYTQNEHIDGLPLGTRGGTLVKYTFPADGEYLLAASLFRPVDNADSGIEGQEVPHEFQILVDGVLVHQAYIGGKTDHDASVRNLSATRNLVAERMKVRTTITAGLHEIGFTFVARPARSQDIFQPPVRGSQDIHVGSEQPKLTRATITGPYSVTGVSRTASRARLYVCTPTAADETACARRILSTLARRAYRRPVTEADVAPLMEFFAQGRKGRDFDAGLRAAIPRVLTSPAFLFRTESDPAALPVNATHPVTDLELASRLSFFLWSSIPDDELLDVASRGQLRAPGMLEKQVRRMLADPRAEALTRNFPDQWLALRNLEKAVPDLLGFPEFDDNLRQSFARETELFFGSLVQEDRSALDLLNADYSFLNERLARHYGIRGVLGPEFRRVSIPDPNRRGILGQGSVLTLTSVATRTSPVFRGKYILTTLLGLPAPIPPPNVPALEENGATSAPKSVRERLEAHRRNPVCASCHRTIDPLGFALENFNAVGQWRSATESGAQVDASGTLVDGSTVDGPAALRKALASRPDAFVGTLTERLLIYALGRGLEPYDMPVVRGIVRDAAKQDYRMMALVNGIVQSRPFQNRRKLAPSDTE